MKQLPRKQVPNLCVMIRSVNHTGCDACVLLKDPSGEMQGTVHRKIVEDYQTDLKPGCVMVLRKVGFISSVTHTGRDACVLLKDPSVEMQGRVHCKIVEDYQRDLKPCCVMVLRKVGVMICSVTHIGCDACMLLKDPSGEMQGMVHCKIVKVYQTDLKPG